MKRRLFNVLAAMSLVLCVAIALLHLRSTHRADFLLLKGNALTEVVSWRGTTILFRSTDTERGWGYGVEPARYQSTSLAEAREFLLPLLYEISDATMHHQVPGILRLHRGTSNAFAGGKAAYAVIVVSDWSIAASLFIFPLWRLFTNVRFKPRKQRVCHRCGYDLRATPDRCPECGSPAQPKSAGRKSRTQLSHQC